MAMMPSSVGNVHGSDNGRSQSGSTLCERRSVTDSVPGDGAIPFTHFADNARAGAPEDLQGVDEIGSACGVRHQLRLARYQFAPPSSVR
jgi:hypothetical protein